MIELLVVIAVIALLMSILMPALNQVKGQARSTACQSNLKQWGLIFAMYANDYGQKITTEGRDGYWLVLTHPYLNIVAQAGQTSRHDLYFCPTAKKPVDEGGRNPFAAWHYYYYGVHYIGSYGINAWVYDYKNKDRYQDRPGKDMWRTLEVKGADNIPVLMPCYHGGGCPDYRDEPPQYSGEAWAGGHNDEMKRFCLDRHDGFVNSVFMDWSVRRVGLKELWRLKWHRSFDTTYPPPNWPDWMKHLKE